jgi:subtilisin family serine protease
MATYILIPRQRSAAILQAQQAYDASALSDAMVDQTRSMLAGTPFEGRPILAEAGLVGPAERIEPAGSYANSMARDVGAPRVLSSVGAVLIDDPPDEVRQALSAQAIILPNEDIPLVGPVEEMEKPSEPWHLEKINVAAARAKGLRGDGVRIGIVDTGIDANHHEFTGKSIIFAEFDTNGFLISTSPRDAGTHGTHVSALAAGRTCGWRLRRNCQLQLS